MIGFGFGRLKVAAIALGLCLFVIGVTNASASHFRYGHITWEKDLNFVSQTEYKVHVTFEVGFRWTYPYGGPANACVAPLVGDGPGACPPPERVVASVGAFTFPFPAKVNGATTTTTSVNITPTVTSVDPAHDIFYGTFSFDLVFPIAQNPFRITYNNCCRLSTLLDNNHDQSWNLTTVINAAPPNTKSPKSTSLPLVFVTTGADNDILLPSVAFDNAVNTFRISTTAESALVAPTPVSPSVFSLDAASGMVHFHPRATGLYAVQFMIQSRDVNNVIRNEMPLDLIFQATAASTAAASLTSTEPSIVTANVGTPLTFDVTSSLSGVATPASWNGAINYTTLPDGATFTIPAAPAPPAPPFTGAAPGIGRFSWTPTLSSVGSVVCFQSVYTNGSLYANSPGLLCFTINIGALATTLTLAPPPANGFVGQPLNFTATLTRTIDGAPLPTRSVTFTLTGPDGIPVTSTVLTNTSGIATVSLPLRSAGQNTITAVFTALTNELLQSSSASSTAVIKANSSLGSITLPAPATVGFPTTIQVPLSATSGGTFPAPSGSTVTFTVTPPLGGPITATGTTNAFGVAAATFTPPSIAGSIPGYAAVAQFDGNDDLFSAPTNATTSFPVYQRIQLASTPLAAAAGAPVLVSATLAQMPQNTPLPGRQVTFTFPGTGVGTQIVTTDTNGVASLTVTFPNAGAFAPTVSTPLGATETNHAGLLTAESASGSAVISLAATALSTPATPALVALNAAFTATSTLTRTVAPAGGVNAATVTFTLTRPNGTTVPHTAVTDVNGLATASFTTADVTLAGTYSLVTSVPATTSLAAATSAAATFVGVSPVATQLIITPLAVVSGQPSTTTVTLQRTTGTPLANETVTLSIVGGGVLGAATTDVNGVATVNWTPGPSLAGNYKADFAGDLAASPAYAASTATNAYNVSTALTSLTALAVPPSAMSGDALAVSTILNRTSAPAGVIAGSNVVFTLTGPSGPNTVVTATATTDASGAASASFPLGARGSYTVSASYGGTTALAATVSNTASFSVYQRTSLALTPVNGVAGGSATASATLTTIPQGTFVAGETVTFDFGGAIPSQTAVTNGSGVATASVNFPNAGTFPATASFLDPAAFFVNDAGAPVAETSTASATIVKATTTLADLGIPSTALVGNSLSVSSVLSRVTAPSGVLQGANVTFTLTGPAGPSSTVVTLAGATTAAGVATVSFPLTSGGAYSVTASYGGSPALEATSSNAASLTLYQRTHLTLIVPPTAAGSDTTISASLTTVPQNVAVAGESVAFDFGGVIPSQTAVTSASGVATVTVNFPNAGSFAVSASFLDAAAFFTNSVASVPPAPETASSAAVVTSAQTSLAPLTVTATALAGDSLTVGTTLSRITAPSGLVAGQPVTFALAGPSAQTLTATTDATGAASVSFPLSASGVDTVSASFAGTGGLSGSSSNTAAVTVYQRTSLALAPSSGVAGAAQAIVATLTSIPGGSAVSGQTVTFAFGGVMPPVSAITDAAGNATVTVVFPNAGTFTTTASFANAAAFFADHTGTPVADVVSGTATVSAATTSLAPLTVVSTEFVGNSLVVSTVLNRVSAPSGPAASETVTFTLAGATTQTLSAATNAAGAVSVSFPLSSSGAYTVTAQYAGSGSLATATSNAAPVTAYQRTFLTVNAASAVAGAAIDVSAQLSTVPGNAGVAGQVVTFTFGAGAASQTATTNAAGIATATVVPQNAGTFPVTASFSNLAGFFADQNGAAIPTVSTSSLNVAPAVTALQTPAVASTEFVGNSLVVSTALSRVSAPVGGVAGAPVTFTVNGASSQTLTGTTDANGLASVVFPIAVRGTYSVTATFAGTGGMTASSSGPTPFTIYQRAALVLAPASGVAATPQTVTATLTTVPQGAPLANQTVSFDFGGVIAATTASTDASGVATVTVTFPNAGTFPMSASFVNTSAFYANHLGAIAAETSTGTATMADNTPPVIAASVTGPQGSNNWYTGDVVVSWTVTDAESPVTNPTGCGTTTVTTDGVGISVTCSATSTGGTASKTVTFNRDASAPVISVPASVSVNATSSAGAIVAYTAATAADPTSAVGIPTCTPASNTQFAIAVTTVSCSATNDAGLTGQATFTVSVVNNAPVGINDLVTTNEDTSVSGNVLTNDTDVEHNTLHAVQLSSTSHGSLVFNASGAFTYTPNADYNGPDSFTYKPNDGIVDGNATTVSITVVPVNDAPVAAGQSVSTNEDTAKVITLAATDVDGDALAFSVVTPPAHGTLTGTAPALTYLPAPDYNGADSFTFKAFDGALNSNVATVTIAIAAVNDPPVANDDAATTNANTSVSGNVLTNDHDVDSPALTAVQVTGPSHGTLTLSSDGSFTYMPATDYSGPDSFTYAANDGITNGNTATVSLTVLSVTQVAAQTSAVLTAIDPGLANDVAKITSGNPKNNCQDAVKLQDKISKDKKYTAAEQTTMIAAVAALAQSIGCP